MIISNALLLINLCF